MESILDLRDGGGNAFRGSTATTPSFVRRLGSQTLAIDAISVAISFGLAIEISGLSWILVAVIATWPFAMAAVGAFDIRSLSRGTFRGQSILAAGARIVFVLALIAMSIPELDVRAGMLLTLILSATTALARVALSLWIEERHRSGELMTTVLARGTVDELATFTDLLRVDPAQPYKLVALQPTNGDDLGNLDPELLDGVAVIPQMSDPVVAAVRNSIQVVAFVGRQPEDSAQMRRIVWQFEARGIDVCMVPLVAPLAPPVVDAIGATGLPALSFRGRDLGAETGLKLVGDKVLAALGLVLLSPAMAGIALAVKLTSPGPVLFRQVRVGSGGEQFTMLKFRSMVVNAEELRAQLEQLNQHQGATLFKLENDPRVTQVGRFLRRYSLDELPQLVNVVRGEMSLVGPRPPLPNEVANFSADAYRRFLVRPGLTGLWQVSGRSNLSPTESTRLDTHYVEHWSPAMDLSILVRTVRAVFSADGAY